MKISYRLTWLFALIAGMFFQGCRTENNAEQLKQNIIEHEAAFNDLVNYFNAALPDSNYILTFGVENRNTVHLVYYKNEGNIAGNNNSGGNQLKLNSSELQSAIDGLGWTTETVSTLIQKLKKVNAGYIRKTADFGSPVNIFDKPGGFVNSQYHIYPLQMLDTVKTIHGEPVGKSDFLKRVYIITSGAL